jgi:hypothetical protein
MPAGKEAFPSIEWDDKWVEISANVGDLSCAPIKPRDCSDMSLSDVLHWVALWIGTKDGQSKSRPNEMLEQAYTVLRGKVVSSEIALWGRRHGHGLHETVPGNNLIGVLIDLPLAPPTLAFMFGDEPYIDADKLFSQRQLEWSDLRIKSADVLRYWPDLDPLAASSGAAEVARNWALPAQQPSSRALRGAWLVLKSVFGPDGPPRSLSMRAIVDKANARRPEGSASLAETTVRSLLNPRAARAKSTKITNQ